MKVLTNYAVYENCYHYIALAKYRKKDIYFLDALQEY